MTDPLKGYISLQEAADLLGVSRPTVYRRALAAEQYMNSTLQKTIFINGLGAGGTGQGRNREQR
ncbi:MAG: hypothetical protein BWY65_01789 [Firmicutes bacterium ADurb.Bin373]|nr:MAG: hypothetical protein BWY65_01789 [Firmicutes bacterium ADurb.Bin373]